MSRRPLKAPGTPKQVRLETEQKIDAQIVLLVDGRRLMIRTVISSCCNWWLIDWLYWPTPLTESLLVLNDIDWPLHWFVDCLLLLLNKFMLAEVHAESCQSMACRLLSTYEFMLHAACWSIGWLNFRLGRPNHSYLSNSPCHQLKLKCCISSYLLAYSKYWTRAGHAIICSSSSPFE